MMYQQWKGFTTGQWMKEIDVRDFIQKNYTPYEGNGSFLASASDSEASKAKRRSHSKTLGASYGIDEAGAGQGDS